MSFHRFKRECTQEVGVLCGSDEAQEWLLPWWWSRYSQHCNWPVTFCDFGMSEMMKIWCRERGEHVDVDIEASCITSKEKMDPKVVSKSTGCYADTLWVSRLQWFKKPFALLHSPYRIGLWIDSDCEILRPITELVSTFDPSCQIALSPRPVLKRKKEEGVYLKSWHNGGVMVFSYGAPIIETWAKGVAEYSHQFVADDLLLSYLIDLHQLKIQEFPEIYNWRMRQGINFDVAIYHWLGPQGKEYIRNSGGLQPLLHGFTELGLL